MTVIGEAPEREERGSVLERDPQNMEPRDELVEILQKVADVSIQQNPALKNSPYTLPHV